MVDLSSLQSFGNAAGFVKRPGRNFDDLLRSAVTDITVGSITIEPRAGNAEPTYRLQDDGTSINALGMPNLGLAGALGFAKEMADRAKSCGKRLRWSIAGATPSEYAQLAVHLSLFGRIECNLGCPNVWGEDGQKPIASFNLDLIREIIKQASAGVRIDEGFDLKLSPYSDPSMIPQICDLLRERDLFGGGKGVENLVVCNTFPNGALFCDGNPALSTPGGYGGIAGNAMHLIAVGQVAQFVQHLSGTGVGVIGVGGVNSGERLLAMLSAGAVGVQIGTHYGEWGARIFSNILEEVATAD